MKRHYFYLLFLFFPLKGYCIDYPISISGNVIRTPCTINNGGQVTIDFSDISTLDVGKDKLKKEVKLNVSCGYYNLNPYVKLTGNKFGAYDNILATDNKNLGIALYQGSGTTNKLIIGEGTMMQGRGIGYKIIDGINKYAADFTFTFTALPFSNNPNALLSGSFSAVANLSIIYN